MPKAPEPRCCWSTPTCYSPQPTLPLYSDLGLGLVDASVIAVAERLELTTIATLNRRDFAVVRPIHTKAFELIP